MAYLAVAVICTLMGAAGYYMYGTGALDLVTFNMVGPLAAVCASVILVRAYVLGCVRAGGAGVGAVGPAAGLAAVGRRVDSDKRDRGLWQWNVDCGLWQ